MGGGGEPRGRTGDEGAAGAWSGDPYAASGIGRTRGVACGAAGARSARRERVARARVAAKRGFQLGQLLLDERGDFEVEVSVVRARVRLGDVERGRRVTTRAASPPAPSPRAAVRAGYLYAPAAPAGRAAYALLAPRAAS